MRVDDLDSEHRALWSRVVELWALARTQDDAAIRRSLHPAYTGWVTGSPAPHDREAAVHSVGQRSPRVLTFELEPLGISVIERMVGIVHYSYQAEIETDQAPAARVGGRWTEVYLKRHEIWLMIAVSGGPNGQR